MEIDHPGMFYSRITQFTVLTLLTPLRAGEGILVTSASKHSAGINTVESEFTLLPLARLIVHWTPLKISKCRTSNIVWLRCWTASTKSALMALLLVGFDCRLTKARRNKIVGLNLKTWQSFGPHCLPSDTSIFHWWNMLPRSLRSGALGHTVAAFDSPPAMAPLRCYSMLWMKDTLNEIRPRKRRFDSAFGLGTSAVIAFTNWMHPFGPHFLLWATAPPPLPLFFLPIIHLSHSPLSPLLNPSFSPSVYLDKAQMSPFVALTARPTDEYFFSASLSWLKLQLVYRLPSFNGFPLWPFLWTPSLTNMHVCVQRWWYSWWKCGGDMFCLLLINGCIMLVDKGFQCW